MVLDGAVAGGSVVHIHVTGMRRPSHSYEAKHATLRSLSSVTL